MNKTRIIRELRELVWPRRSRFAVGLLLVFINRISSLVLPGSTKFLLDDVVANHKEALLIPLAAAVGTAFLIQAASSYALTQLLNVGAQQLVAEMRIRVQAHIGKLPVQYYDKNKTGALVSRIMTDVEGLRNLVGTGLVELIGGLFTAIVAFGVLLFMNSTLTLISLGFLAVFVGLVRRAFGSIRPIFRKRGMIHAEVSGRLTESLAGVRVVKGFRAEDREAATFQAGAMRLFQIVRDSMLATSITGCSAILFMGVVTVTLILVGGRMLLRGSMTIGDFFAFSAYLAFIATPVLQIVNIGSQLTESFAGLDRIREVLDQQVEDVDPERSLSIGRIKGHLRFEDVTYEYESGKPVLKGVSFVSHPGTITALVGPSGSGKSTIVGLVAAFGKPTSGCVHIDGIDLATVRLDSYRSQLGVVFQDNFLFDGSISENIRFGRPDASDDEVFRAAAIARVDEFASPLENGLDTIVGERGLKLSGGQRQRVAIARAILADPRILLLDEATSSLDYESEALVQEGLAALMKGRTTVVIAHRFSTIRRADQILFLDDGVVTERGTHDELIALTGRYFDLHMRQADIQSDRLIYREEHADIVVTPSTEPPQPGGMRVARTLLNLALGKQGGAAP